MHVTEIGSVFTIVGPLLLLGWPMLSRPLAEQVVFVAYAVALVATGLRTTDIFFAAVILPFYLVSLPLVVVLPALPVHPAIILAAAISLTVLRTGVCMSVALHRYAAHAAFRCHKGTSLVLAVLGCLANQGGPLWWASQHRCHHRHSDQDLDPHSPAKSGVIQAFCFFDIAKTVEEEYVPPHMDGLLMRILDTFAFVPVITEQCLSFALFGYAGLYITYTSQWLCQALTLWFNIVNHPPLNEKEMKAVDYVGNVQPPNFLFRFVHSFLWVANLIGESAHHHHHTHAALAHRPGPDVPFHIFVRPLCACGLVWDLKMGDRRLEKQE